jgi:hypothetical protein
MGTRIELTELTPFGRVPLREVTLQLTPHDNVAVAKAALRPGTTLICDDEVSTPIPVRQFIPTGVLADLDIRSKIVAIGPRLGRFASPIAFSHNLLHHSQERIGPCG